MKTVFLSSTAKDLGEHRTAAYNAIQAMDGWRCVRMEDFGARDSTPDDFCRERVTECDVFVGIVGHMYGTSPPNERRSFTECEYDAAVAAGKPCFMFLAPDTFRLPVTLIESDAKREMQGAFRQRVSSERIRGTFESASEIGANVVNALRNWERTEAQSPPKADGLSARLVSDCSDPDILFALDLYENRIPENEKFEAPDIVRWLREDQEQRARGVAGPRDYFIIAKFDGRVCGFTLLHYYPTVQLAFIAYLVSEKGIPIDHGFVSHRLIEKVASVFSQEEYLSPCKGFLLEVDDPRTAASSDETHERLARIRLFCLLAESLGSSLRGLDFDYRQPMLWPPSATEAGREVPMMLMYASRSPTVGANGSLPQAEVSRLLQFVYKWLYPEGFSEILAENARYRQYLDRLFAEQTARLPTEIPLLSFREIRARARLNAASL